MSWLRIVCASGCLLFCLAGDPCGGAEDLVIVSRGEGQADARRMGEIVDYTGEALTLSVAGGRQEQIPAVRVVAWNTTRVPEHENADQLCHEGRFADAVVAYQRAMEREKRTWLRRLMLAQLVGCYRNMEQFDRAGEAFLLLLRSDPTALRLDVIPLAWKPIQPPAELVRLAERWLADEKVSAAALLGASWLLATAQRDEAVQALERLTNCPDSRLAQLAVAQRWRADLVTASREEVARWEQLIKQIDPTLQAGPAFVLGQALARHGEPAAAALAFLRVPILYPDDRDLAAEALLAAGEQLEKSGDTVGARTAYRQLVQRYAQHVLAGTAEQRLAELPAK